jgi:filamentous hemagglutinin
MAELKRLGTAAGAVADSTDALYGARRTAVRNVLWEATRQASEAAGLGESFASQGDINLAGSKAQTRGAGDMAHSGIDLFSPGGRVLVGYSALSALDRTPAIALNRGLITNGGSIRSFSDGDFQVNAQKVFVIGTGDLTVYSTNGNIDSGRGSNTDVAASDPQLTRLVTGEVVSTTPPPVSGSGIGIVKDIAGNSVGKVNLLAPRGEVRALDAFIQGPEVNVPGPALGADNIKSASPSGPAPAPVSVNLSVNTGLGSDTAAGSAKAEAVKSREKPRDAASVLTVDVLGVGDAEVPLPPTAAGNKADTKADNKVDTKDCTSQNGCPRK